MPLVALLPALIGAGGMIGSSLISKKSSSSKTPLLPPGLDQNALLSSINTQKGLASTFQEQGADLLGKGRNTLNQPLEYWQHILGGDRTKIMEAMAPGIAAINAQFKAPLTEAGITSRGSSLAPDLEASRQSAISNQIFQAQPVAADKLSSIAQGLMSLGVNQEQAGAGVAGDVSKELLDYNSIIRGIQAQSAGQNAATFGQLGMSLGPILAKILQGTIGKDGPAAPTAPAIDPSVLMPPDSDVPMPGIDPAVMSSLLNMGSDGPPEFNSSWLNPAGGGVPPR